MPLMKSRLSMPKLFNTWGICGGCPKLSGRYPFHDFPVFPLSIAIKAVAHDGFRGWKPFVELGIERTDGKPSFRYQFLNGFPRFRPGFEVYVKDTCYPVQHICFKIGVFHGYAAQFIQGFNGPETERTQRHIPFYIHMSMTNYKSGYFPFFHDSLP